MNNLVARGVIFDFDGVFTDNKVYVDQKGVEAVRCSRSDGIGLEMLRDLKIPMVVISTESNKVVSERCKKLKIECFQNVECKVKIAETWAELNSLDMVDIAFVGNDINDLLLMNEVGYKVCVRDAYPELKQICDYVLQANGGEGAVRELCEHIAYNYKLNDEME